MSRVTSLDGTPNAHRALASSPSDDGNATYDAFISYCHAADRRLASEVQRGLHRIAKPWYRLRSNKVFRDDTSLAANPALWDSITAALDDSRYLILFASPGGAESEWVNREVAYWQEHKSIHRVMIVQAGGQIVWDEAAGDFDWDETNALPDAVRGLFRAEPRHIDMRWVRDEQVITYRDLRFRESVAELAAPLRGVPKDELIGEDTQQQHRTRRIAWTAATALVVLLITAIGAGIVAFLERNTALEERARAEEQTRIAIAEEERAEAQTRIAVAEEERAEAQTRIALEQRDLALSRQLAASAEQARIERLDLSLLLGLHALDFAETTEARSALLSALQDASGIDLLLPPETGATKAVFSPDGESLLVSTTFEIETRNASSGDLVEVFEPSGQGRITDFATHPGGEVLAVAHADGRIGLWDLRASQILGERFSARENLMPYDPFDLDWEDPLAQDPQAITALAFDLAGRQLAGVDGSGVLYVWEYGDGTVGLTFASEIDVLTAEGATGVAFITEDHIVVSGSGNVAIVEPAAQSAFRLNPSEASVDAGGPGDEWLYFVDDRYMPGISVGQASVALPGSLSSFVGLNEQGAVFVVDARDLEWMRLLPITEDRMTVASFADEGLMLASGDTSGGVWVWEDYWSLSAGPIAAHADWVNGIDFHPSGTHLVSTSVDGSLAIHNLDWGRGTLELPQADSSATVTTVDLSADGRYGAAGFGDGSVALWDAITLSTLDVISAGSAEIVTVRFLPDSSAVVTGGEDGSLRTWVIDAGTLTPGTSFEIDGPVAAVAVDAAGGKLAASGETLTSPGMDGRTQIKVWDLESETLLHELEQFSPAYALSFTADGDHLLANGGAWLTQYAVAPEAGGEMRTLEYSASALITALASHPDEPLALVGTALGELALLDLARWTEASGVISAYELFVDAVAFSPDGSLIATAGGTTLQLWDASSARPIGAPFSSEGFRVAINELAWHPGGDYLAVAGLRGLSIVDTDVDSWKERACRIAGREMTPEEWEQYVGDAYAQSSVCGGT